MSKRVILSDEQLYILRQMLQDQLNISLRSDYWVYKEFGSTQLQILLDKLSAPGNKQRSR